ncbi:MAG: DUF1080 domain-containing protein [Planctomycetota bacterium]
MPLRSSTRHAFHAPRPATLMTLVALGGIAGHFFQPTPSADAASTAPVVSPAVAELPAATITGDDWTPLSLEDFVNVNGTESTWIAKENGEILCSGKPIGGARSKAPYTNFEMVMEWKHETFAGNSGLFLWCPESAFTDLPPGQLPRSGIEVQVLDLGYDVRHLESKGGHSDWFTSHGDVFPVGASKMTPFTPSIRYRTEEGDGYDVGSKTGARSFPTQRRTRGAGEWNHYYVRAINGEVRLWVNGEEVNGARDCEPRTGYLALEAEGAPIRFRNLRIRELP